MTLTGSGLKLTYVNVQFQSHRKHTDLHYKEQSGRAAWCEDYTHSIYTPCRQNAEMLGGHYNS
jgi:hypothetical protein